MSRYYDPDMEIQRALMHAKLNEHGYQSEVYRQFRDQQYHQARVGNSIKDRNRRNARRRELYRLKKLGLR